MHRYVATDELLNPRRLPSISWAKTMTALGGADF